MTADQPLRLADHLAQRTATIVGNVVTRIRSEVDFYRSLPDETVNGDVGRIVRRNFEMVVRVIATGAAPTPAELAELEESARDRADEQVPLGAVLDAYQIGAREWLRIVNGLDGGGGAFAEGTLAEIGDRIFRWLRSATGAVIAGYDVDNGIGAPDPRPGHVELLDALLAGDDHTAAADRFHLTVADQYWAVAVTVDPSSDETDDGVSHTVAAARKARRLRRQLDGIGRGEALYSVTACGGVALVPLRSRPATTEADEFGELKGRLEQLAQRMGVRTTCAVDLVRTEEIPSVIPQLQDLVAIARRKSTHRPVVRFDDLAVEFQLSRPTRATRLNAARLDPIADDPVLWRTLETYLDSECNSTSTAESLHVHPNTVQYRLRKISDLTGLNLSRPVDVLTALGAVLAANDRRRVADEDPAR